jgi:hypothetical protein
MKRFWVPFAPRVLAHSVSEVYVTGAPNGVLGSTSNGSSDTFLRRLNGSSGATVWTNQ